MGSEEDIACIQIGCDYRMGQGWGSKDTGMVGMCEREGKERGKVLTYIQVSTSRERKQSKACSDVS